MKKTPCEELFWSFLPALRGEFVRAMVKQKMKRKDITKLMGLSEPAISQYLKDKRGRGYKFSPEARKFVEGTVKTMNGNELILNTCRCCIQINKPKVFCPICPGRAMTK